MTGAPTDVWTEHVAQTARYYERLIEAHGVGTRGLDYGSEASQRVRFDVLAAGFPKGRIRVLDVGCGLADFAVYLESTRRDVHYVGVDICPRMIAEARRLRPHLLLSVADVLHSQPAGAPFDVVTANGIFYLIRDEPTERMHRLIARMWELSAYAVAFTSLSTRAPMRDPGEFHADPLETLAYCQSLTPFVVLRHDYLLHDFAVYLYREQPA